MRNSVSEQSFYFDSEEEGDEEKQLIRGGEGEEDGTGSDSDDSFADNQQQSKPSSYNTSWPQSYRQSIDLYSSVPSPSINFLGTPTRFGSSFLSSSLTRRHTPEFLTSAEKPLLQKDEDDRVAQQRRSSHTLLPPPIPSRGSSTGKDEKPSHVSHGLAISRGSSFKQAVVNGKSKQHILPQKKKMLKQVAVSTSIFFGT
uniref:Uncharacterized protein n=1 Tax=Rhizophora mucronata TaxID=61149 RepID=A0A2P2JGI7_RHIMU